MYDKLVKKIMHFLEKDDVISDDLVISAYDLNNIINDKFGEFNDIVFIKNFADYKISNKCNNWIKSLEKGS